MFGQSSKVLPRGLPDCLKKRGLLNDKTVSPEVCREYGEKFLALGFWEDALEFFSLGNCQEGLDKLKAQALEKTINWAWENIQPTDALEQLFSRRDLRTTDGFAGKIIAVSNLLEGVVSREYWYTKAQTLAASAEPSARERIATLTEW